MSLFKRISATVHANLDRAVTRLENHDAVVEVAIREGREALAQAKVRLARVRRDRERLEAQLRKARGDHDAWTQRARGSGDEKTALECIRRRRGEERKIQESERSLVRQREMEGRLAADVDQAEGRLRSLSEQRHVMRTRESAAQAMGALSHAEEQSGVDVEEAFERWEVSVTEAELAADHVIDSGIDPGDSLERRFEMEEEHASLKAELEALRRPEGESNDH